MSTWGHKIRPLTAAERRRGGCFKCGADATHEATFLTAGRHGGAPLTNRLRYCVAHARSFAERNRLPHTIADVPDPLDVERDFV